MFFKKKKIGYADYISVIDFLDIPEISSNNDLIAAVRGGQIAQWGGKTREYTIKAKMKDSFYSVLGFKVYNRSLGFLFTPYRKYNIKKLNSPL